jgi:hypothetical protein
MCGHRRVFEMLARSSLGVRKHSRHCRNQAARTKGCPVAFPVAAFSAAHHTLMALQMRNDRHSSPNGQYGKNAIRA